MNNTLTTRNLAIGYESRKGSATLHQNLHLTLGAGEMSCILGPNGAGKSTLIKTLAGFMHPIDGEIFIMGKEHKARSFKKLSRLLSVVLTERIRIPHLRVIDVVRTGRYPYTSLMASFSEGDHEKVQEAIEKVGIGGMAFRFMDELSDGEKQKVMIAKALAQDTPVIILDEPTAFLDFPSKIEVMQILMCLTRETGKSVLLSTHDVELALQVADKIWLMDRGKNLQTGCPEDLVLNNELNRFFERDYIYFDEYTGTFLMKNRSQRSIGVNGSQPFRHWLAKALYRIGYNVEHSENVFPQIQIQGKNDILLISSDNQKMQFTSIDALVSHLKKNQ